MAGDFDLARGIAATATGRAACWAFITDYAAAWLTPLGPADGYTEAELVATEDRLGVGLPAALREAYRLLGRRVDLTSAQDRLMEPAALDIDDGVLIFRLENQWVTRWGIRTGDLAEADPPVVYLRDDADHEGWFPYLDRFSLACVEMALSESLLDAEISDNLELDDEAVARLEQRFDRLPFPDYPLWANPDGPPTRWFGDDEVMLRDDSRAWLWVQARTPAALDRVREALPGDWLGT